MSDIKFGTDGWRAIIAREYTVENVMRVAEASARWLLQENYTKVVIGHDCRFGGEMFAESAARVFAELGIEVFLAKNFVSTPMVSLGVLKCEADLGIVITASHNPPSYNGYKLKSKLGGPSIPSEIAAVEDLIPPKPTVDPRPFREYMENGNIEYVDLETLYIDHIRDHFDLQKIQSSGINFAYDAMFGAGQNAMKKLFPEAIFLHCDDNPGFHNQAPEPLERNLKELAQVIGDNDYIHCGIAHDGDADRIGMFDGAGKFVDSHHLLLLLLRYLHEFKKMEGKIVVSFSVTNKLKKLAERYGLDLEVTKIGFKYIAEIMANESVLVGGEESGGLAVSGHIPERDGVWIGLTILEYMAETGKSLSQLVEEIHEIVGAFDFERDDLHITEAQKQQVLRNLSRDSYDAFGELKVVAKEKIDGYKFYFDNDEWVMVRASGTEPVLRVYAQGESPNRTRMILDNVQQTIL